jgi:hypothetical protein
VTRNRARPDHDGGSVSPTAASSAPKSARRETGPPESLALRIEDWRRRLIDLSHRNRLIAFRPTVATTLTIAAPSIHDLLADPEQSLAWDFYFPPEAESGDPGELSTTASTLDRFVLASRPSHQGRRPREIEVTEQNPKRIARILDNLAKRSNNEFQDKALRILYLAVGFLDWYDAGGEREVTSPLVLVPVELRRESTRDPYRLFFVDDEEIVINPSLTEKLRRDAGLSIPGDWAWEDKAIAEELDEIRQAIKQTPWTVREAAVLGLFSFQKYVMYRDLLDNEAKVAAHPIVRSLALGTLDAGVREGDPAVPGLDELDEEQPPSQSFSILDSDASQRQCIEAAVRGRSFVMQGPPGTGKSQTIANVIAEAIGRGKRVLFVSEKAAALDVVYKRLAAKGLDEYCLLLHGEHAGRRDVVKALDRSLTTSLRPRRTMRGDELERLANLRTLLNTSAEMLHLPQPLLGGRTVREVHEELAALHAAPSVPGAPRLKPARGRTVLREFQGLSEVFQRLAERWHVSSPNYVWRDYVATDFTADDHGRVISILRRLRECVTNVIERSTSVADAAGLTLPEGAAAAAELAELGAHIAGSPQPLEPGWLKRPVSDFQLAASTAGIAFQRLSEAASAVVEIYPLADVRKIDSALPRSLELAVRLVIDKCGSSEALQASLHELPRALEALDALPRLLDRVEESASAAASFCGQPAEHLTQGRIAAIAELSELAFSAEHRPERTWFVRAGADRAEASLDAIAGVLESYQREKGELLNEHTEAMLELDAAAMAERFAERYTSVFSKLGAAYRRDSKALKAAMKDGAMPRDPVASLRSIADLQSQGVQIDAWAAGAGATMGSYLAGRDTRVSDVRAALATARAVIGLADPQADLDRLARALGKGTTPDPAAAQAADRLRDADQALRERLLVFDQFISPDKVGTDESLDEIAGRLDNQGTALRALADVAAALDLNARAPARGIGELVERASSIERLYEATESVAAKRSDWESVLGGLFEDERTDWPRVARVQEWLARLDSFGVRAQTEEIRRILLGEPPTVLPGSGDLSEDLETLMTSVVGLQQLFDEPRRSELGGFFRTAPFSEVDELMDDLEIHLDELRDWTEWRDWSHRAQAEGWDGFVAGLLDAHVGADEVVAAFGRAYWSRRLEALFDEEPDLAEDLRGGAFQRWVDEFRELDRQLVRTGSDRLITARERGRSSHLSTRGSETELLQREARKVRRHLPVRVLLARMPVLLSELKPCLMMSPLSVSHFLAADHTFDLVVFDEASQVPPQDAINCIYRGAQMIVAGDSKQLPPTPFFQIAELDELKPDEEDLSTQEDMESILDSCEALFPSHSLRWHYRSLSEQLIAFSNRNIYDSSLVTFPSVHVGARRMGVAFTHVPDGVYDRGGTATNRREAQVVAHRVVDYLTDGTGRSVGVIAFNSAQATAIGEELDLLRAETPAIEEHFRGDRLDAVFVKHLEAVQGDERDVIVFSVGYGRDSDGRFTMNFGPLNKEGGQRRLNVAVTRARQRIEVVSSVRAVDFNLGDGASAGATMLMDYLRYAETGGGQSHVSDDVDHAPDEWPTRLEAEVAKVITELGYEPVPRVGIGLFRIDIGVALPGQPNLLIMGVECDGQGYADTPTARDRERLRHEVLAGLGWGAIHRVWSLDWVRNRNGEIERLRRALESAQTEREREPVERPSTSVEDDADAVPERIERKVIEINSAASAAALPWTETYVRADLGRRSSFYEFHASVNRIEQANMLISLLAVEAPVSIEYATRRLAEAWSIGRIGHRVEAACRQAIAQAQRRKMAEVRGGFIWRPGQVLTSVRVPADDDPATRRDIADICPEEIDMAIERLRAADPGLDDSQLVMLVARVLGFERTGDRIRKVLIGRIAARGPS